MSNQCGQCTMCCKLYALTDPGYEKPTNVWCKHCVPGVCCKVYEQRPTQCSEYVCLWLYSQQHGAPLAAELQPNKSKVVLDINASGNMIVARVDPAYAGAEKSTAMQALFDRFNAKQIMVYVITGEKRYIRGADAATLAKVEAGIQLVQTKEVT